MNTMQPALRDEGINLAGTWALASASGQHAVAMAIPGDVHSALILAGAIDHPYKGRNEDAVQWVAQDEWVITRTFTMAESFEPDGWYLDIDYLDTVADVLVNGELVLSARNCFRRYRPDVSHALKAGGNRIEILFKSNPKTANELQASMPFYIPYAAQNCPIPNGNMLRKPACHFGWDWNIAIAPLGLYGRIELNRVETARIEHVQINQSHAEGEVALEVMLAIHARRAGKAALKIAVDGQIISRTIDVHEGYSTLAHTFAISDPKLWWPAGHGSQNLYDIEVSLDGQVERRSIGLRTVELITDADAAGNRFAFKINGQEIYCRGSNWIPADALPSAATAELTEKLLQAAVDSNQNMIRVWGGGFYEPDYFYDLCDRMGLLVWQDFMFACNLYPSTPDFLEEVRQEADYQVRRLQHHACIALWCGDNELIGALTWFEESRKNRDRYLVSYDRLNRTIETAMKGADGSANWWPSSPSPGPMSFGDAWHDDTSGDMHFWSVWHEGKDFDHYRSVRPRFCSEFGFQSFASMKIARQFASGDDLNISSPVMESHQKNAGGNARIAETMFRYFRFPKDFADFVYLSQVQQGLAIKTAVEFWRSLKPHNMGSLYWQLNDTWPVASWASLDHGGGWKVMHHMVKRFFQPAAVFAVPSPDGDAVRIVAVNDRPSLVNIDIVTKSVSLSGAETILSRVSVTTPPDKAVDAAWLNARDIGKDRLLVFEFSASDGSSGRGHFALRPYKQLALEDPHLHIATATENGVATVTLTAAKPALFVSMETDAAGRFDDGGFDMMAGERRTIRFLSENGVKPEDVYSSLVVRNLHGATHAQENQAGGMQK
ncbi:MAG: glycoside hydrolase family 2 protein [Rhizobiaceae bacterium]